VSFHLHSKHQYHLKAQNSTQSWPQYWLKAAQFQISSQRLRQECFFSCLWDHWSFRRLFVCFRPIFLIDFGCPLFCWVMIIFYGVQCRCQQPHWYQFQQSPNCYRQTPYGLPELTRVSFWRLEHRLGPWVTHQAFAEAQIFEHLTLASLRRATTFALASQQRS
jgi:hypothetical protein